MVSAEYKPYDSSLASPRRQRVEGPVLVSPHEVTSACKLALSVSSPADEARALLRSQKEQLHLKSQESVKNWTNTIMGQRRQRLAAREEEQRLLEEERRRIDAEWSALKRKERQDAVDRARMMQYVDTSRVRELHARMLLSNVILERQLQVKAKKELEDLYKKNDQPDLNSKDQTKQMEINDIEAAAASHRGRIEVSRWQKKRAEENEMERERSKKSELEAQRLLNQQIASELTAEEAERVARKHRQAEEMKSGLQKNIRWKEVVRREAQEQENALAQENERFNNLKVMLAKRKKEVEGDRARAMSQFCDKVAELNLEMNLDHAKKRDLFVEAMANAHAFQDEKRELADKERRHRDFMDIKAFRDQKVRDGEAERQRAKEEEAATKKEMDMLLQKAISDEKERKERQKLERIGLRDAHLQQMKDTKLAEEKLKELNGALERVVVENVDAENERFTKYATEAIEEFRQAGRNVNPIIKILHKPRPFPPPVYTLHTNVNTFTRLGFI